MGSRCEGKREYRGKRGFTGLEALLGVVVLLGLGVAFGFVNVSGLSTANPAVIAGQLSSNIQGNPTSQVCSNYGNPLSFTAQGFTLGRQGTAVTLTYTGQISDRYVASQAGGTAINVRAGGVSDLLATATGFLPTELSKTLGCAASDQQQGYMPTAGGISLTVANSNTSINSATIPQGLGNGQSVTMQLTFASNTTIGYFSHPTVNKYVVIFTSNNSAIWSRADMNLDGCNPKSSIYTTAQSYEQKWECPGNIADQAGSQSFSHALRVVALSGQEPDVANTTARIYVFPEVPYIDTNTNIINPGNFEDNRGSLQSSGQAIFAQTVTFG